MSAKKPARKSASKSAVKPVALPYSTVSLVHGAGEIAIELGSEKALEVFRINVMKRDLRAFPWEFQDRHGTTYILRDFLFCRIVIH